MEDLLMNQRNAFSPPENVRLKEDHSAVVILDQSKLPQKEEYLSLSKPEELFDAIYHLKVRGAPAIGIFAGYGIYVLARTIQTQDYSEFVSKFRQFADYLDSARPTAVNLHWALERMSRAAFANGPRPIPEIIDSLCQEACSIQQEDILTCRKISEYGLSLIKDGDGILTHCNAGPLATSCYGTALGPLILGKERGMEFHVFADETRPLLQGARLTTYELDKAGIDVTLICDNMASLVMKNGWIQACFVGCDRIAANGDTANKIGTSSVAILARYYQIPFYVLGPTSTIDLACPTGKDIPIEQRAPEEIREMFFASPSAASNIACYNPSFDVTEHELITAIVTEHGICYPPYGQSLYQAVMGSKNQ